MKDSSREREMDLLRILKYLLSKTLKLADRTGVFLCQLADRLSLGGGPAIRHTVANSHIKQSDMGQVFGHLCGFISQAHSRVGIYLIQHGHSPQRFIERPCLPY